MVKRDSSAKWMNVKIKSIKPYIRQVERKTEVVIRLYFYLGYEQWMNVQRW